MFKKVFRNLSYHFFCKTRVPKMSDHVLSTNEGESGLEVISSIIPQVNRKINRQPRETKREGPLPNEPSSLDKDSVRYPTPPLRYMVPEVFTLSNSSVRVSILPSKVELLWFHCNFFPCCFGHSMVHYSF